MRVGQPARRPLRGRLEYRLAADLVSCELAARGPEGAREAGGAGSTLPSRVGSERPAAPTLLVASALIFVHEALVRLDGNITLVAETPRVAKLAHAAAASGAFRREPALQEAQTDNGHLRPEGSFGAAIWAAPQRATWRERLGQIDSALCPGAPVALISAGPLARLIGAQGLAYSPVWRGLLADPLGAALGRRGYRSERIYLIGGVRNIAWVLFQRVGTMAGRPDLADRFEIAYRQRLADPVPAALHALTVRIYRKEGGR